MTESSKFLDAYNGKLIALRQWQDLDDFWQVLMQQTSQQWYAYAVGEPPPDAPLSQDKLRTLIIKLDQLLRRDHNEDYCGIVYADDHQQPTFVKIYDPNNLGSVCGSSGLRTLPGWTISQAKPVNLEDAFPPPGNRRRWWQKLISSRH